MGIPALLIRSQGILLLLLVAVYVANVVYCAASLYGIFDDSTVVMWDLYESIGLLVFSIIIFISYLSLSVIGWWLVILLASTLCVYEVVSVLAFKFGEWRYLYLFCISIFYSVVTYKMFDRSFTDKIPIIPPRIGIFAPKILFSLSIAFLFMYIFGSGLVSMFIGVLMLFFISERRTRCQIT